MARISNPMQKNLIVGISGATGMIYGITLLSLLQEKNIETRLTVTKAAERTRVYETDLTAKRLHQLANSYFPINSNQNIIDKKTLGMIVAPCAMKTLAEIAWEKEDNLLLRSAINLLKQQLPVILLTRETPLHLGHLRNMQKALKLGATIFPPMLSNGIDINETVTNTLKKVMGFLKNYD